MSQEYSRVISECDTLIRSGRAHEVQAQLNRLDLGQIPDRYRLPLAKICSRSGLLSTGLKLLTPIVCTESHYNGKGPELAEYGLLLMRNGSTHEASAIFQIVDPKISPEVYFYNAIYYFTQWNYEAALPQLEKFLAQPLPDYMQLVARVNKAAALVATESWSEAFQVINQNIARAKELSANRLLGNALEQRAQFHLGCENPNISAAESDLNEAAHIFAEENTFDRLFVKKWLAVIESKRTQSIDPLLVFRRHALLAKHWETVRDTDRLILRSEFQLDRYNHLMFGTPYAHYRRRLHDEHRVEVLPFFFYGDRLGPCMDVTTGNISGRDDLNAGKKIHQVIEVLLRDLYRPWTVGSLFTTLFPEEKFSIFHSPARTYQILGRARQWLKKAKIPVELTATDEGYSLEVTGPFCFRLPLERKSIDGKRAQWLRLETIFRAEQPFTAQEAREALGFSLPTFNRLIRWAQERNLARTTGIGKASKYIINSTAKSKIA